MRCARTRMLCGIALVALFAVGCGSEPNAPPSFATAAEPGAALAESEPEASVATDTAPAEVLDSAYSGESEQPELPADVPLYASATPVSSMSSPTRGTIVHLRSPDAGDLVSAWYGAELPARGWHLETQSGVANSHLVTAVKDGRKATVLITGGPDETQILLTVLGVR